MNVLSAISSAHRIRSVLRNLLILTLFVTFHFWLLGQAKFIIFEDMFANGWYIKKGLTLYRDIGTLYPPGAFYLSYLFLEMFGYTYGTLQGLVYGLVAFTDMILFIIVRSWFGLGWVSVSTLALYAVWHVMLDGKILWYESMLTPFLLIALHFFRKHLRHASRPMLMVSGLFFGLAMLIKQPSVYPIVATLIYIMFFRRESWKKKLYDGVILVFIPLFGMAGISHLALGNGVLPDLWYWLWHIPVDVYARHAFYQLQPQYHELTALSPLWMISGLGFIVAMLARDGSFLRLLLLWAIAVSLFAYPRWGKFHLLPFVAITSLIYGSILQYLSLIYVTIARKFLIIVTIICLVFVTTGRELKHFFVDLNPRITEYLPENHALLAGKIKEITGTGSVFSFENVHQAYAMIDAIPIVTPTFTTSPMMELMPEVLARYRSKLEDGTVDFVVYFPAKDITLTDDRAIPLVLKKIIESRYSVYREEWFPEHFIIFKKLI